MPRVVHFEIHADNPERAAKFYTDSFGWKIQKWNGPVEYWMVMTGEPGKPGINGGLMRRHGTVTGDSVIAFVCTLDVPSVDDYVKKVIAAGGTIVMPKSAVPGIGWMAYGKDTEGNIFGLMQEDPNAR
ncbi:MAG: VOC family protein [candidate division Zixibacteria bacterium]|nr:VOC family protein [candidate division Zixibacteria bacterium]